MKKRVLFILLTLFIVFLIGYFIYTGNNLEAYKYV